MSGWCPKCGRRLGSLAMHGFGTCSDHGRQAAEFAVPKMVLNTETVGRWPDVVGFFLRTEEDAVFYRRPNGTEVMAPSDCVEIVRANEISGGEW